MASHASSPAQVAGTAELVTDSGRLAAIVEALLRRPAIGFDTESDSYHRYPERICLVQIAARDGCYLIDPLAIEDMAPLGRLLADRRVEKIMHSADYDLRSLDRQWGFRIHNLYDTAIAAHFAGLDRLGLASIVQHFLGTALHKPKSLQRADWSLRPISEEALRYAASDVLFLLPLRDALEARLAAFGRVAWVREECARLAEVRYVAPEPPGQACLRIKGSKALDGRGLAVLASLATLREREARQRGRPPFRVLSDETLLFLAANPRADLAHVPGLGPSARAQLGKRLQEAIRRGLAVQPLERPAQPFAPRPRFTARQARRFERLRAWRAEQGKQIGLDPALIWPMASLERLAQEPTSLRTELDAPEVRRWQAARFGPLLGTRLETMDKQACESPGRKQACLTR